MSFVRRANITDGLVRDDLDKILSNKKCNLQFTSELEVSNGKNLWKPSISNDSYIIAELVCIQVSFEGCRIEKCAQNRTHSHTDKIKTEPITDFIIELDSIPARVAPRIGDWELKRDTVDGDAIVRIKVTGKNVVTSEKNISLSFK